MYGTLNKSRAFHEITSLGSKIKVAIVRLKCATRCEGDPLQEPRQNSRPPPTVQRPPRVRAFLSLDPSGAETSRPWRPRPAPHASPPLPASRPPAPASGAELAPQWPPLDALPEAAGFAGGACGLSCAAPPLLRPGPEGAGGWRTTTPP
jgi:hypothetical protein